MENICDDFKSAHPPVKGALLPAKYGDILKDGGEFSLSLASFLGSSFASGVIVLNNAHLVIYVPG